MSPSVILAGASVRSLAESAVRSGLQPLCLDMFGDQDLQLLLREAGNPDPVIFTQFEQLPQLLEPLAESIPLVWTGGLENHPSILQEISRWRPVCGACPADIARLRTPSELRERMTGVPCRLPETITSDSHSHSLRTAGQWLVKPRSGSGGIGIRLERAGQELHPSEVLQRFIPGQPASALYCCDGRTTQFLGLSVQIVGESDLGGSGFAYCGSVGPVRAEQEIENVIVEVGQRIGATGVRGVFGADFVLNDDGAWLIEVNPRITASHELYDQSHPDRPPVLRQHLSASTGDRVSPTAPYHSDQPATMLARLIVYQRQDFTIDTALSHQLTEFRRPTASGTSVGHWIADIPPPGPLVAGQPCCSVYHVLRRHDAGWAADRNQVSTTADRLIARMTGVGQLNTAEIAVRQASLFERFAGSDNSQASELPTI